MGMSEVKELFLEDYGITRRSANLYNNCACAQIVKNLDKYERKDPMAWINSLTERVYL